MDINEIRQTDVWQLYEKGRDYCRAHNVFTDTDRNHRFYNGNQWEGAKLGDVEPVQKNFIKPIVKYKVAVIHDNLYAIVFSPENYENPQFQQAAQKYCAMLTRYEAKVWEQDKLNYKGRRITKDAAINDEGILYIDFDTERMLPVNEIIDKNDIYYGNENSDDIQSQPYILLRRRMPVVNAMELALSKGMSQDKLSMIIGDNDTFEESGDDAKLEVDDQVTVVYKLFKEKGTVRFSIATRYCDIVEDADLGIPLYPIAHFIWEEKKGSARGEGEVRSLIPNQIEVNKTEVRRTLTVKMQAYPQKVVDASKVANPNDLSRVGAIIKTQGNTVDDVRNIVSTLQPAQMSRDVKELQDDLVQMSRELAGAGDLATGSVNPENASGKAILAVQDAARQPLTGQKENYKSFVEDVARIHLEYLIAFSPDGVDMEDAVMDPQTGEETVTVVRIPQSALQMLKANIRVDVTPKSVYDRFAQEQTIENLLTQGFFNPQRIGELEIYARLLDDDSVAPKAKIMEAIRYIKGEQKRIAELEAKAQAMQQRASQFLMGDPDSQASQMAAAMAQMQGVMQ